MRTKLIEEGVVTYLAVAVNPNFHSGFVSKSGKSWVERVMGTYIKVNGEVGGRQGKLSGYISHPFGFTVVPITPETYGKSHVDNFDFQDDFIIQAVLIHVKEIKY